MSSIRQALLSLLAREPLSGYDIKQRMNNRLGPFWKVGSNQVYPELARMEEEGLVALQGIEQHDYRPARKLYEITEAGKEAVIRWTTESGGADQYRDDFLLKAYNSWLVDPERMIEGVREMKKQHEEKLAAYEAKVAELTSQPAGGIVADQLFSSISVIEFGVRYERLYVEWCEELIAKLSRREPG